MTSHSNSYRTLPAALFIALSAVFLLDGCALNHTDRSILAEHGVSTSVREKMTRLAPLTLPEIVELSHQGMLPEYITQYLRATHEVYHLSSHDSFWLNRQGVSSTVVTYLLSTPDTLALRSDRMAIIDWPPYFTPFYGRSLNAFGDEYYLPVKEQLHHSLPTLSEQEENTHRIISE